MQLGDIKLESEFEDDICFFYGDHKLHLKGILSEPLKK
jgi:hypothetical protein